MVNIYYITYYGLKDEMLIFQFPFMAESRQTLCAKRFSNLSQTIFRLAHKNFTLPARKIFQSGIPVVTFPLLKTELRMAHIASS
mgnify:CR=1 FL=1